MRVRGPVSVELARVDRVSRLQFDAPDPVAQPLVDGATGVWTHHGAVHHGNVQLRGFQPEAVHAPRSEPEHAGRSFPRDLIILLFTGFGWGDQKHSRRVETMMMMVMGVRNGY